MATMDLSRPVELIPPAAQPLWGWPAVVNFTLGGLGAGLYVIAALPARFGASPAVTIASWLGPALVLAGFVAVATEAGRPRRGPRVLLRVRTSWMSRELWLGGAFVLLAAADLAFPLRLLRAQAVVAALAFALAQGFILRHARGVTAWSVPIMPLVFLASALVSGSGLYLLIEAAAGRPPAAAALGGVLALLAAGLVVWVQYVTWCREEPFAQAVRSLGAGRGGLRIIVGGYFAPFWLVAPALALPLLAVPALALAGALMVGAQVEAKRALVLQAGQLRPITLTLRIHRRSP